MHIKRILQVFSAMNAGGAETFIMNIYRHIDRSKIQFDFIVQTHDKCFYDDEIYDLGGKIYYIPKLTSNNYFTYRKAWNTFFKRHKGEYHIIHGHAQGTAAIYLSIARKHELITFIHSHNTSSAGNKIIAFAKDIFQYPIRWIADEKFACSEDAAIWLYGKKQVKNRNINIIQNAIDIEKFSFSQFKREVKRKELQLQNKFVVGHIGRFNPQKNHLFLLDIFKAIHDRNRNAILLLIGDGELRPQIEKKIIQLGLEDSVILTGVRMDTAELYQAMDVFVFPSLFEGLGIVSIEAQAAGLRCIVSDVIPHEALITDLIEPMSLQASPLEWAKKILKYSNGYERKDTLEQIREAGYDIKEQAKWLEKFYIKRSLEN
ncbi:glycosyltransferase family 1 protein [Caproiciproducens sp. R2]|uniref:glycosyltransferase family 1 protein n=1 Tax=Caproiciproducens sp. R2 TaxID=3435187 RepID=UPI00403356AD